MINLKYSANFCFYSVNITLFPLGQFDRQYDFNDSWVDPRTGEQPFGLDSEDGPPMTYYYATTNETFDSKQLQENGSCQPSKTYKWGFSSLILFVCLLLLFCWSVGTYILWLKAHMQLQACGEPDVAGEYKAVLELATAMTHEFKKNDECIEFLRERQIKGKIKHVMNGGTIWYDSPMQEQKITFWTGFKQWAKDEKWWWLVYALSLTFFIIGACFIGSHFPLFLVSLFLLIGVVLARIVGQTGKSRFLIVLIFLLLSIVPAVTTAPVT
jgi:hypothetical protein